MLSMGTDYSESLRKYEVLRQNALKGFSLIKWIFIQKWM